MFKLVIIAGKLRGKEFVLSDGENSVGRESDNDICLPVAGISKQHLTISVTDDVCFLKDLGSSNGTFLNGKLIKSVTVKDKDKISLPDTIVQLVYVKEKKIIIKQKISSSEDEDTHESEPVPDALPRKIIYYFKHKVMKIFHDINKEYEWKILLGIILAVCVIVNISLTIFPALQDSKRILEYETSLRGAHFADEISRLNSMALSKNQLDRIDTKFLEYEQKNGVKSYELFDLKGRIYRPLEKLNEHIADPFSIKALSWAEKSFDKDNVLTKRLGGGEIGIARKILMHNLSSGVNEPIAIIAIRFAPKSLSIEATKSSKAYLESLVTSLLVAIFFYGIIYFLTTRPLLELHKQIEEALRGKRRNVESEFLMIEITPLRTSINSILQRIRELQHDEVDAEFDELEDDSSYVEKLIGFSEGAGVAVMVLDSEKNLKRINIQGEDLTGIRETASIDDNILEITREQGLAGLIIELCDNCANNNGLNQQGTYEVGGSPYAIHVNGLIGKDNFAKGFYITFIKDE